LGNKKSSFLFCLKTTKKPSAFLAKASMYQKNIEIRVVDALFCFELSKKNNGSFAVLMVDLDRFKEINDTPGHYKYCSDCYN